MKVKEKEKASLKPQRRMMRREIKFAETQDRNMHTSLLFVFSFNSPIRTLFTGWNYTQLCFRGAWQQQKNHTREYQINELNQQASFLPLGFFGVFILHSQMYTGANFLRLCYTNQKFAVLFQWEKGRRYQCSSSSCTTIRPLHQARLLAHTLGGTNTFACHWAIMCDIIYNQSNDISFLCSQRTTLQQGTSYRQTARHLFVNVLNALFYVSRAVHGSWLELSQPTPKERPYFT